MSLDRSPHTQLLTSFLSSRSLVLAAGEGVLGVVGVDGVCVCITSARADSSGLKRAVNWLCLVVKG